MCNKGANCFSSATTSGRVRNSNGAHARIMKEFYFEVSNGRNSCHLIPYIGNKSGFVHIFDRLISDRASRRRIYDVFGGSGAFSIYACRRFGSKNVTYNDNNLTIVNFIKWVKRDPKKLADEYHKHKQRSSIEYFLDIRNKSLDDDLVGAGRFLYLAKNAFSGKIRFNGSNKFNAPMRKDSKCPNLDFERLIETSNAIRDITITNESYQHYSDVKKSFVYLDPPYMGNTNNHYNGVPDTEEFIEFVKQVEQKNLVMISEQNDPHALRLSDDFRIYPILLKRSLQYNTKDSSREIIAINYRPPQRILNEELVAC